MWTNEKIEKLIELYPNTDNNIISIVLEINKSNIVSKANKIGLKKDKIYISEIRKKNSIKILWTDNEINFLINNYKNMSNNEISIKINKTKKSVIKKLKNLKLYRTKEEKDYITSKKTKENGRNLTFELIRDIAKKYNTRQEFYLCDCSAYSRAQKNKWLDIVCSHMIQKNFSIPQLILKDILENVLLEKCSYNDRKIIKPLEIDCYFKKWNIGFEYDGKYYHNEERDNFKFELCLNKGIRLFNITENTENFRNYEKNIKEQLITFLPTINKITNKKISVDDINNYNPKIIYPNILSVEEKEIVYNKNLSDIKINNCEIYKKIKKYKLYEDDSLLINYDIKKYNRFNNFNEYKKYLINKNYNNFTELCQHEHPHRLMKKWNISIEKIKELYVK